MNLERVDILLQGITEVETLILSRKAASDDESRTARLNITNKATMQEHLRLIRLCTSDTAALALPATQTHAAHQARSGALGNAAKAAAAAAGAGNGNDGGLPSKRPKIENATGLHGGEKIEDVPADVFRIKNRGPGGVRVVKPGVDHKTANNLHLLDKVREFHERTGPAKGPVLTINGPGWQRKLAESYAKELGLAVEIKGQYPKKYVVLRRPLLIGDEEEVVSSADAGEDAFAGELKRRVTTQNDAVAATMGEDEVGGV